ncbi:hypothetical protein QBC38DRAFT_480162, partial [Podospora fimiseda]
MIHMTCLLGLGTVTDARNALATIHGCVKDLVSGWKQRGHFLPFRAAPTADGLEVWIQRRGILLTTRTCATSLGTL